MVLVQTLGVIKSLKTFTRDGAILMTTQPFSQNYDLASHTTCVVCVNFMREWRDSVQLTSTLNKRFLRHFMASFYLLSEFLPQISPKKYFRFDV